MSPLQGLHYCRCLDPGFRWALLSRPFRALSNEPRNGRAFFESRRHRRQFILMSINPRFSPVPHAPQWRMKIGVTAIEALGVGVGVGIGFFRTSTPIPIATPTPMDSGLGYFLTRFRSEAAQTGNGAWRFAPSVAM